MSRRFALAVLLSLLPFAAQSQIDPDLLAGLRARAIGPAAMSGRVAAIDAVASDPKIIYVGAATGGVWKSMDGGVKWTPVFDDQPVAAIGAVAVNQQNPDIVWVGTGESNVRNSASVGNGVYRSLDGGATWKHLGLDGSERISRIVLHPSDPDTAWVAAMGRAWGRNPERGVFRTTDGGRSWIKVLYVDDRTGAADLDIDPGNPSKLVAAMWEYRRWPWFFNSGGPGSGLYLTHDGGATWTRKTEEDGMPAGMLGRIGVKFAPSNPQVMYALVEAEKSALLRSEDGGRSWKPQNTETDIASRPFYYADIRVDPKDPNRLYSLATTVTMSEDGGRTFRTIIPFREVHPDHHAMWIHPGDPNLIIEGNDGGVAISRDRGRTWSYVFNLPLGQYYHINVDMETPYNVYGGMQDNGSWRGPSAVWENGGIRNHHWTEVGFGDGFGTVAIDALGTTGFAMSQGGNLMRWDLATGQRKDVRPAGPPDTKLRFNWNAAIAVDPFDPDTVWYGSQFVHRSSDRGETWSIVSGDLTTNNPAWQNQAKTGGLTPDVTAAENFTTIVTIAPSAVERGVVWTGSDDGRIHVSRDGGNSWTSVEGNVRGVPRNSWVPHIEPSKFDGGTAFAVFDDHRRSNWTTYVQKTTDYGKTWTSLATPDLRGYALVLEQDPVDRDLLFLGTEFGLWISTDGGKRWTPFRHGFPTVSTMALMVHPRDHDLIIGTHGRSAYVIDDIRPLRGLAAATMTRPIHLFPIPDAQQYRVRQTGGERFPGDGEFRGENEPYGAMMTFVLNADGLPHPVDERERERKQALRAAAAPLPLVSDEGVPQEAETLPAGPEEKKAPPPAAEREGEKEKGPQADITITDAAGQTVRKLKAPVKQGINRVVWNLRRDAFRQPPREREGGFQDPGGPEILPGTYGVSIRYEDLEAKGSVNVLPDPRFSIDPAARAEKWALQLRAGELQQSVADAIVSLHQLRSDVDLVKARLRLAADEAKRRGEETSAPHPLVREGDELRREIDRLEKLLWIPPQTKGIVDSSGTAWSKASRVGYSLASSWDAPTAAQKQYFAEAEAAYQDAMKEIEAFRTGAAAAWRDAVAKANVAFIGP